MKSYENEKRINKALLYAEKMHDGQKRLGGEPYIIHPKAVASEIKKRGYDDDYVITALFHDLLEDTAATESDILRLGGERVLEAVKLLTKRPGYNMREYVSGIKSNKIAFVVKGFDRLNNVQSAVSASEDFKRRYLEETELWYLDFLPEIKHACEELKKTLKKA